MSFVKNFPRPLHTSLSFSRNYPAPADLCGKLGCVRRDAAEKATAGTHTGKGSTGKISV